MGRGPVPVVGLGVVTIGALWLLQRLISSEQHREEKGFFSDDAASTRDDSLEGPTPAVMRAMPRYQFSESPTYPH